MNHKIVMLRRLPSRHALNIFPFSETYISLQPIRFYQSLLAPSFRVDTIAKKDRTFFQTTNFGGISQVVRNLFEETHSWLPGKDLLFLF